MDALKRLTSKAEGREARRTTWRRRVAAATAAIAVAFAAVIGMGVPAQAASQGPGVSFGFGEGVHVGAWGLDHGQLGYCLEPSAGSPLNLPTSPAWTGGWGSLDANSLARINWAVSTYGQTSDPTTAAAVQMYVWAIAEPGGSVHGVPYSSVLSQLGAGVTGSYNVIAAEGGSITAGASGSGTGTMVINKDNANTYNGNLVISSLSPAGSTGTVTLTNGIFVSTGTNSAAGLGAGTYAIRGVPPTEDGAPYSISAAGTFNGPGGWAGQIGVWATPGAQAIASPGGSANVQFNLAANDPDPRTVLFQPVASTTVSTVRLSKGDVFSDQITWNTVADAEGVNNSWFQRADGSYLEIVGELSIFGPFSERPVESADVPADAPLVETVPISSGTTGPGVASTVTGATALSSTGYYTAVVTIDAAAQSPLVQLFVPAGYTFQDAFGQVQETSIVPADATISTQLVENVIGLGRTVVDEVTLDLADGEPWLTEGGEPVPVTATATSYYVTAEPVQAATAPADAVVVETQQIEFTGEGTVPTEPFTAPYAEGWLVVQVCITGSNIIADTCDDWGVPSETAEIKLPTITTKAVDSAQPWTPSLHDVAIVEGPIPAGGIEITFDGYLNPRGGEDGEYVCTPENLVVTSTEPIFVDATGEFTSESWMVLVEWIGQDIAFVESAYSPEGQLLAQGECGEPSEITPIEWPKVTTKAVKNATPGGDVWDTATVTGAIPDVDETGVRVELTFEAFYTKGNTPVCSTENRILAASDQTPITVGDIGDFDGPLIAKDKVIVGWIWHVETLTYVDVETGEKTLAHVGECGAEDEITVVSALATTGDASTQFWVGGLVALALLASGAGIAIWRKKVQGSGPAA